MPESFNKRFMVAIFSAKCCMLYEMLVCHPEKEDEIFEEILESMFNQSYQILGWQ